MKKTSGSKVNFEKTKCIYIGSAKNNRPKFTKEFGQRIMLKLLAFIMVIIYKMMRYGNQ